jgi:uncharacterized protein
LLDGAFALDDKRIVTNSPQRCYYYKAKILEAMQRELPDDYPLLTGTNADDEADFRPGIKAKEEMGIKTSLRELRFTKEVIREHPGDMRSPVLNVSPLLASPPGFRRVSPSRLVRCGWSRR